MGTEGVEQRHEGEEGEEDVLDLTGNQLSDWESVVPHLRPTLARLELTLNRLTTLGCPDLAGLQGLVALGLRSNLISNEGFEALPAEAKASFGVTLRELVLYENQLVKVLPPSISTFGALEHLDVSYNEVRSLEGVQSLRNLRELYAANNKIVEIVPGTGGRIKEVVEEKERGGEGEEKGGEERGGEGVLADLVRLEVVELGSNRLRSCAGFEHLRGTLRELWLGRNKIVSAAPLRALGGAGGALRRLSLASNRLTGVEGVESLGGAGGVAAEPQRAHVARRARIAHRVAHPRRRGQRGGNHSAVVERARQVGGLLGQRQPARESGGCGRRIWGHRHPHDALPGAEPVRGAGAGQGRARHVRQGRQGPRALAHPARRRRPWEAMIARRDYTTRD